MSGDKAQLTLLVGDVIYNQETHTNKGEAHECNEPQKLNKKLLGFYYETYY